MKREESRHDFAFMAGVVIGAVAGALATLAMAPRAGGETRERWKARMQEMPVDDLRARAMSMRDAASERTGQLREAASNAAPGDVVQSARARATEMIDRSPLPVTLGDAEAQADDVAETLADAADEAVAAADDAADEADTLIEESAGGVADAVADAVEDERKDEPQ